MSQCVVCPETPERPSHDPDYERGYLCCLRAADRMLASLRQIPALVAEVGGLGYVERDGRDPRLIDVHGQPMPHFDPIANGFPAGPLNGSKGAPRVSGSSEDRVPIRIDPTDLLSAARPGSIAVRNRGHWAARGGDPDQIGNLAIATELEFWARDWADDRGEHAPIPLVPLLCSWLADRLDWACRHHYALDEFAVKLRGIHGSLLAAAGRFDAPPETVDAQCPGCHMLSLYRDRDAERIACGNCAVLMTDAEYAQCVLGSIRPEDPSMKKIPTLFLRDPEDMKRVTREVHPDCQWVIAGEGVPTRKYDGTCVMFDGVWWARREVKRGKTQPPLFTAVETDEKTGKTVGWEPLAQSAFAKYHAEALAGDVTVVDWPHPAPTVGATYELVGPKVNGNPEKVDQHMLVRHGYQAAVDREETDKLKLDYDSLRSWLLAHDGWEGIVWHHPDGRMAKLKRRDFPA